MNDPFLQHYRTLGIEPGCTPDQLKYAYRRLVKAWHPDHYPHHKAGERALTEQRMREINRAFRSLSDFHRHHGYLPVTDDAGPQILETPTPHIWQHDKHFEAGSANEREWGQPAPKFTGIRASRFILLGMVLGLLYGAWVVYQKNAAFDKATTDEASEPAPGTSIAAPPTVAKPTASRNDPYFTFGSALGKVYAAQGVPTKTEEGVWFYGKSKVFFVDGAVSGWEEDPENPLKTEPLTETPPSTLKTFGIGSTTTEVKAIQGNPLSENNSRWDYGLSQVFFQDGKVTGWYESPLTPLKTHK
jgi:hypothetical protein